MTVERVVFDAEPLLSFAFDENGADEVERWLDRVYDAEVEGYVATINLAEFRYVAARKAAAEQADAHIDALRDVGLTEYGIDGLWRAASTLKARNSLSIGDAYALAAARDLDDGDRSVTLLVGADDDYDAFEGRDGFEHLVERFRDSPA